MKKVYFLAWVFIALFSKANAQPATAAPIPPSRSASNVVSIYNDAPYTSITGTDFSPNWGQSPPVVFSEITISGNKFLKYTPLSYQGIQFTATNVSSFDSLHLDIWTPDCTKLDWYLIANGGGGEKFKTLNLTTSGWNSINIKLSDYSSQGLPLTNIFQFKFVSNTPATGTTVYLDNIYFFTNASLPTITNFTMPTTKKVGDASFAITTPTSNSTGAFTYTSSNTDVATISGNMVTITGAGNSTITATQAAAGSYGSGSATATLTVGYNPPTAPPGTPTALAPTVISLFSNAYANRTVDTWNASWGQATFKDTAIAGNDSKRYANLNYCGIEFTGPNSINATTMLYYNVDVWTPNTTPIKVKLVDFGANNVYDGGGDDKSSIELVLSPAPTPGVWKHYSIPFTSFTGLDTRANLSQMLFVGSTTVIFVDNIYFSTLATLPTNLAEFKAVKNGNTSVLTWKTATEINNKGFAVERSANGKDWIEIAFVNGSNNSNTVKEYTSTDNSPLKGFNYYRLKQVDNDGKQTYSATAVVRFTDKQELGFSFYPNPVKGTLTVSLNTIETATASLNMLTADGKIIKSFSLTTNNSNNSFLVNVANVAKGAYYLVLTDGASIKSSKILID